jgi:hypothetical protein
MSSWHIFPHILMAVSVAVQKLFSLMQSHFSFFLLDIEPFEYHSGSHSLCLSVLVYFLLITGIVSKLQVLH